MDKQYVCAAINNEVCHLSLDQIAVLSKQETACNRFVVTFEYSGKERKSLLFTKDDENISYVRI